MDKLGIPGNSILVLVSNRTQLFDWNSCISSSTSSNPWCRTYNGFIKEELNTFYPLLTENCKEILDKDIRPLNLSTDGAVHLISKVIQARREKDGIFPSLVSSNERIAAVIANNLCEAALEGIPANEIGTRLYESLEKKDIEKKRIFEDMDKVLTDYRKKCLELGVFDVGMAVEAYNAHMLENDKYKQLFFNRIRYFIVDDIQECPYVELKLIELLLGRPCGAILAYDGEYSKWGLAHDNKNTIEKLVVSNCKVIETVAGIDKDHVFNEMADKLFLSIKNGVAVKHEAACHIERHPPLELRSEMLEKLSERVCSLIENERYLPSDIVIISTYADTVTELVIGNILCRKGYKLFNPVSRRNISDNRLCSSMLVFAKLCHPEYSLYPEKDKVKLLLQSLLGLDPVRSAIIARKTVNTFPFPQLPELDELGDLIFNDKSLEIRYMNLVDWVSIYKKQEGRKEIGVFLQAALIEVFLSDKFNDDEFGKAKRMIDEAESYSGTASKFNRVTGRDYIEMAEKLSKEQDNTFYDEDILNGEHIILTTPSAYLSCNSNRKVMIFCSLSSRNWSPGRAKELTNQRILSATWQKGMVYTTRHEEEDNKEYVASMIRALIKKGSEKIITFESQLSENGYENDGVLSDIFMGIAKFM
jgi:hypothetical protein